MDNSDQKPPSNFGIHRPKENLTSTNLTTGQALSEFLPQLETYTPVIPDAVSSFYMNSSGLNCSDPRIVRLISIAAQKFISDVANDALQHCKTRSSATQGTSNKIQKDKDGKPLKDKKYTLTVEDLAPALNENYGITVRKAHYFV